MVTFLNSFLSCVSTWHATTILKLLISAPITSTTNFTAFFTFPKLGITFRIFFVFVTICHLHSSLHYLYPYTPAVLSFHRTVCIGRLLHSKYAPQEYPYHSYVFLLPYCKYLFPSVWLPKENTTTYNGGIQYQKSLVLRVMQPVRKWLSCLISCEFTSFKKWIRVIITISCLFHILFYKRIKSPNYTIIIM